MPAGVVSARLCKGDAMAKKSYRDDPDYETAKSMYMLDPRKPSLASIAEKLGRGASTLHYWAKQENWKHMRELVGDKALAQAQTADGPPARRATNEPSDMIALLNDIQEIRTATPAKLRELMENEGLERERRYLILMRSVDLIAAELVEPQRAMDRERLAKALATLMDKAQLLAGLPTSRTESTQAPQRAPRPRRAHVGDVRGVLGTGGGEAEAEVLEGDAGEGEGTAAECDDG